MYGLKIDCEHLIEEIKKDPTKEIPKICTKCQKSNPKSLAIFILSRIGMDELNTIYLDYLNELIDLPFF